MNERQHRITETLSTLAPDYLEVLDESHRHHVPENAQTHFKVTVVSSQFIGKRLLLRHQIINDLLTTEFNNGLHALSIHAYTPEEWLQKAKQSPNSPACRDGYDR